MEYFAGLDISMEETRVCVVDREGVVDHEEKVGSTPEAIAASLERRRLVGASCLRLAAWRRCSIMGWQCLACRSSASRAGKPIRR